MADLTPIARPYAQAAHEFAKANSTVTQWADMLLNLAQSIEDKDIQILLDNPEHSQHDVAKLLESVLSQNTSLHFNNFIAVLAEYGRLTVVPWIYVLFLHYKAVDEKAKKALITTAFASSDDEINKLKLKLEQRFQCAIDVETAVNERLIAGAIIEIGDQVIDGSIKGKLNKLQHELQA